MAYQETTIEDKNWRASKLGRLKKTLRPPYFFLQPLKLATSNFSTQLRFGDYVTITTLVPNLVGAGWATGGPQRLWVSRTPYRVLCTK